MRSVMLKPDEGQEDIQEHVHTSQRTSASVISFSTVACFGATLAARFAALLATN